ncbi:methylisocitrate lyase [Kordiimonas lacus]|uniref:Methylisocitrate lyase n=1 Tax=Kordiimonas lacus TaxID=637679 RepID=A0A1G7EUQ3_9PROT|nr:methylisocitrate lyase [Kordiimonas lacus]SDE67359.1 methylisocitrate lyase [Kordiimonas lacus]
MLRPSLSVAEKRQRFQTGLRSGQLLRLPGAISPLCAKLIEQKGFDGCYVSGAVLSAQMALPDIGLTTSTEVVAASGAIAAAIPLPTLVDADTGFGEPVNVARTVAALEGAGLSGCHLEDQRLPKRCGHLDNKELVPVDEMCRKIRAAKEVLADDNFLLMARTDARATEGLSAATDRAKAYVDAGADAVFPEALANEAEFEAFRSAISVPLLANMTEFGKSPLLSLDQLHNLGYNMAIYPVTLLRLAMEAMARGLDALARDGNQESVVSDMQTRRQLYDLLKYDDYDRFDDGITNFRL